MKFLSFKIDKEVRPVIIVAVIVSCCLLMLKSNLPKNDEYEKNLILATGFGITIISWFMVGYINNKNEIKRNDLANAKSILETKRSLRIKFLLDAYFRLENMEQRNYESLTDYFIYMKYGESALTSIQLLGEQEVVKLSNNFILSNGQKYFQELLIQLRADLRKELMLADLPNTPDFAPVMFRFKKNPDVSFDLTAEQKLQLTIKLNELNLSMVK